MSPKRQTAICLFAKPPRAGQVKTRLAAAIGEAEAARLARAFLADTLVFCREVRDTRLVLATTEPSPAEVDELGMLGAPAIWDQGAGDLGARLERVLSRALEDSPGAIALGADTPDLPADRIEAAKAALANGTDAVLGPAEDGGFYLLGLRRCPPGLFARLPWSEAGTCRATADRLRAAGLRLHELAPWPDVDEPADLERLRDRLAASPPARARSPATWLALTGRAEVESAPEATISVVVPVVDEAARIGDQLDHLLSLAGIDERIVVDGGSRDATASIAASRPGIRLLEAPRGRARQMNAGAAAARGSILLFLHADVRLPRDAAQRVRRVLTEEGVVAGAFRTRTVAEGRRGWIRPLLPIADARSRYSRLPYGDQALFVRAEAFHRAGGYPDQPLLEDLELSRRLRRAGRIRVDRGVVEVSARRFLARPLYYPLAINLFPLLYRLGVSPARLERWYGHPR